MIILICVRTGERTDEIPGEIKVPDVHKKGAL